LDAGSIPATSTILKAASERPSCLARPGLISWRHGQLPTDLLWYQMVWFRAVPAAGAFIAKRLKL